MYTVSLLPERDSQPSSGMVNVPVWVVGKAIATNVLEREINAALYAEIAHALTSRIIKKKEKKNKESKEK